MVNRSTLFLPLQGLFSLTFVITAYVPIAFLNVIPRPGQSASSLMVLPPLKTLQRSPAGHAEYKRTIHQYPDSVAFAPPLRQQDIWT